MKLFHLSDLHLGKRVYAFSMLPDQRYVLEQVCALAERHQPDGILLSGDLYDKPIPPVEAVQLLDEFLTSMQQMGIAVYAISGNHDSAGRDSHVHKTCRLWQPYFAAAESAYLRCL